MERSGEKLVRDVRVLVQDAEDLIKATAGDIEEKTREARARLAGALVVTRDSLMRAEQSASTSVRLADAWFRKHPYPTLSLALVAGVLIGVLATRR